MNKKKLFLLLLAVCLLTSFAYGCSGDDTFEYIDPEKLSEEATAAFSALDGENGVMVYHATELSKRSSVVLYVVLYGPSGQGMSMEDNGQGIRINILGDPMEDFSVFKVTYARKMLQNREIGFQRNGEPQVIDGLEESTFPIEQANASK